jgi:hypothetical protein
MTVVAVLVTPVSSSLIARCGFVTAAAVKGAVGLADSHVSLGLPVTAADSLVSPGTSPNVDPNIEGGRAIPRADRTDRDRRLTESEVA